MKATVHELGVPVDPRNEAHERDAVHVAVFVGYAGETIQPGERVKPVSKTLWRVMQKLEGSTREEIPVDQRLPAVGIADPFLEFPITRNQSFLVMLFPGSTFNLHHTWEHTILRNHPDAEDEEDGEVGSDVVEDDGTMPDDDPMYGCSRDC